MKPALTGVQPQECALYEIAHATFACSWPSKPHADAMIDDSATKLLRLEPKTVEECCSRDF